MISFVRRTLDARKGQLRAIAGETGIAYDTLLRIKNGEGDPGYSKVARLASHMGWAVGAGSDGEPTGQDVVEQVADGAGHPSQMRQQAGDDGEVKA